MTESEKTAVELIKSYGDIENIISSVDLIENNTAIRGRKKISNSFKKSLNSFKLFGFLIVVFFFLFLFFLDFSTRLFEFLSLFEFPDFKARVLNDSIF